MRLFFVVLLVLNLLAFASAQSWLGTSSPHGEPERLSNQLNPDRIILLPPRPAQKGSATGAAARPQSEPAAGPPATPAAGPAATPTAAPAPSPPADDASREAQACLAYAGLTELQADTLIADAQSTYADLRIDRNTTTTPGGWWVHIPSEGGRDGAERRVAELRALGVSEYFVVHEPGANQYAISLGLFTTEAKALQHHAFLRAKRVRGAVVAERSTIVHDIEIRGPAAVLTTLDESHGTYRKATGNGCTP